MYLLSAVGCLLMMGVLVAVIAGASLFGSSKGSPMNGHGEVAALRAEVDRLRRDRNAGSEVR
ncbi:hypothetical protein BH20ACT3_BH20ACT3_00720 [soil metagenome]